MWTKTKKYFQERGKQGETLYACDVGDKYHSIQSGLGLKLGWGSGSKPARLTCRSVIGHNGVLYDKKGELVHASRHQIIVKNFANLGSVGKDEFIFRDADNSRIITRDNMFCDSNTCGLYRGKAMYPSLSQASLEKMRGFIEQKSNRSSALVPYVGGIEKRIRSLIAGNQDDDDDDDID